MTNPTEPTKITRPMTLEELEAFRKENSVNSDDADRYEETIMRGFEEEIEDLKRIEEDSINTIPEVNFVQVFLPFFAGDEVNPYNVDLSNWLTVAGSPYRPVNIANERGEILYQVPAIIQPGTLSPKEHAPNESIFELLSNTNQMTAISPRRGAAYFREHVAKIHNGLVDRTISAQAIRQWNEIFIRYGRKPIVIPGLEKELGVDPKKDEKTTTDFSDAQFDLL